MHITLTCQSGLESLVRRESEKLGLTHTRVQDRLIEGEGDMEVMMALCMGSRFSNRVYITLEKKEIRDFDTLYTSIRSSAWEKYLGRDTSVVIEGATTRSTLSSIPTIQKISQKAIHESITLTDGGKKVLHVLILLIDNIARIMLDVTGEPLHKRGYRLDSGVAPLKESLAAGLVALSGWKYSEPLWDPCCGSGTLIIEAALIAHNRAPNLYRDFRFELLRDYNPSLHEGVRNTLKEREFGGKYALYASDTDATMVEFARANARRAGVEEDIHFFVADIASPFPYAPTPPRILTNPPYGKRMQANDLTRLYRRLDAMIHDGNGGAYITSYFLENARPGWKNKKILNGADECRLWIYEGDKMEKNTKESP